MRGRREVADFDTLTSGLVLSTVSLIGPVTPPTGIVKGVLHAIEPGLSSLVPCPNAMANCNTQRVSFNRLCFCGDRSVGPGSAGCGVQRSGSHRYKPHIRTPPPLLKPPRARDSILRCSLLMTNAADGTIRSLVYSQSVQLRANVYMTPYSMRRRLRESGQYFLRRGLRGVFVARINADTGSLTRSPAVPSRPSRCRWRSLSIRRRYLVANGASDNISATRSTPPSVRSRPCRQSVRRRRCTKSITRTTGNSSICEQTRTNIRLSGSRCDRLSCADRGAPFAAASSPIRSRPSDR